jgi:Zn-dependent peptidase ImmA (M78 family)
MMFCIAHELFHLIGDRHGDMDGGKPLGGFFHPLREKEATPSELRQVDLPNRVSINKN